MLLPETASWLGDFLLEILTFPHGRYDDQVDSLSQFLTWASAKRRRNETPSCGPVLFVGTGPDWTY